MNKDLIAINDEIELLLEKPPSMDKYQRLGVLFVCKKNIEEMLKTTKSTVIEILDDKMQQIGGKVNLVKTSAFIVKTP